uniref:Protein SDA1 n=1 Tax=Megaselia scalaris TaxID=36166 RepID=T1GI53_MEGSC
MLNSYQPFIVQRHIRNKNKKKMSLLTRISRVCCNGINLGAKQSFHSSYPRPKNILTLTKKPMKEAQYKKRDGVPNGYVIIYKAPMEGYLTACKNITTITSIVMIGLVTYNYQNLSKLVTVPSAGENVELYGLVSNEVDIFYFIAGFTAEFGKIPAVYDSQLPMKYKHLDFARGQVKPAEPFLLNPWKSDTFRIKNYTSVLLIDYFKTPSELFQMLKEEGDEEAPGQFPQLQNLIKRDPESYKEEFEQQYRHFLGTLEIFKLNPIDENKSFDDLVTFISQVAQCYPDVCLKFPQLLVDLLKDLSTTLNPVMRSSIVKALINLRNKNLIPALDLLELFFQLLRCPDKNLRCFLQNHIINDIKNMNAKHKDMKLNSTLQNFMYSMLKDANPKAAKMSVDIMIELFKKNIWNDAKTVNVIASVGCFSKITKVQVASLKFFLGHDEEEQKNSDSESDNEVDLKGALLTNRVNKKTKKRQKQLDQIKKQAVKAMKKKNKAENFNFSGIHLIHNPQGMAEGLFKQLQSTNESFYPYITRFLQPHQRLVTRILQFAAQASHELVPGEVVEPVLKVIANNFVTERNSSDVMAIGLNATREICARCPLAMGEDLLRDLAMYKAYKDKSVMMAARSLIMLYRDQLPALLHKKDRGRPTEAQAERKIKEYGQVLPHENVPGAEVLLNAAKEVDVKEDESSSESEDDGNWVDVSHSEGEDNEDVDEDEEEEEDEDENDDEEDEEEDEDDDDESQDESSEKSKKISKKEAKLLSAQEAAQELALTKIFTDEDFKKIDMANVKKTVTNSRKRPLEAEKSEFVKLDKIEMIYKKRKHDKEARWNLS